MTNNFFTTSNGEELEQTTEFTVSGLQEIIPDGTQLLCAIAGATWEEATQFKNKRVEIILHVVGKGPYKDFIVKDTLKLFDDKIKVEDKAKAKLITYDTLCNGLLLKAVKAGKDIVDDNGLLARALNGGELMATFSEYDMPNPNGGDNFTGNWVRSICAKPKAMQQEDSSIIKQPSNQPNAPIAPPPVDDFADDVPF